MKTRGMIVWQYGTEERWNVDNTNPHEYWEQDGVAPQCAVPELSFREALDTSTDPITGETYQAQRIRFAGDEDLLNFLDAHSVSSYGWIFTEIDKDLPGYVRNRD